MALLSLRRSPLCCRHERSHHRPWPNNLSSELKPCGLRPGHRCMSPNSPRTERSPPIGQSRVAVPATGAQRQQHHDALGGGTVIMAQPRNLSPCSRSQVLVPDSTQSDASPNRKCGLFLKISRPEGSVLDHHTEHADPDCCNDDARSKYRVVFHRSARLCGT